MNIATKVNRKTVCRCWLSCTSGWRKASLKYGCKNWPFSDTPKGATASAQLCSLVETAKANGQEPYAWLRHALERLPQALSVEDFEALLPWNCTPQIPR
jgi:hypothetical protein